MDPPEVLDEPGHLLIAGLRRRSVGQVEQATGDPGAALDLAGAGATQHLELGERALEIVRFLGEQRSQCEGVLDRGVGTLQ